MDAPDGVDSEGDVDIEKNWDGDEEEDEDEEKDDEEVEEEDQEEEEDKDEDDGNEPRTIGQGEMVITSADDVDTVVDNQTVVQPEHGQEIREHIPRPQPAVAATRQQPTEPRP